MVTERVARRRSLRRQRGGLCRADGTRRRRLGRSRRISWPSTPGSSRPQRRSC